MMNKWRKVIWTEGALLSQQHLQQQDDYWSYQQHALLRTVLLDNTGLVHLTIDRSALAQGLFEIEQCAIVFNHGLYIDFQRHGTQRLCCSLTTMTEEPFAIFLVLPRNTLVSGIQGYDPLSEQPAWVGQYQRVSDQYDEQRQHEVLLAKPNLQLHMQEYDATHYYGLKIAMIKRGTEQSYQIVDDFIPSVLSIAASPALIKLLQQTNNILNSAVIKLKFILQHNTLGQDNKKIEANALLILLTQKLILLKHAEHYLKQSPYHLYQTLLELLAGLSSLTQQDILDRFVEYRHAELAATFFPLCHMIAEVLEKIIPEKINQYSFAKTSSSIYEVTQLDQALFSCKTIFLKVSINRHENINAHDLILIMKLAGKSEMSRLMLASLPGIALSFSHEQTTDAASRVYYFSIDTSHSLWQGVIQEHAVALFLTQELKQATISLLGCQ